MNRVSITAYDVYVGEFLQALNLISDSVNMTRSSITISEKISIIRTHTVTFQYRLFTQRRIMTEY